MNWYFLENNQPRGPLSEEEFRALAAQGSITADTWVWREGMTAWQTYGSLLAASAPAQATPAAPAASPAAAERPQAAAPQAPAARRNAPCSLCGAQVPAEELLTVGSAQLCPRCQAAHRRLSLGESRPLVYASPWLRLGVYLLDVVLCGLGAAVVVLGGVFAFHLAGVSKEYVGLATLGLLGLALLWILDYFVGRIARRGATPVMRWFKLEVVRTSGEPAGGWRAWGRFLVMLLVSACTLGLGHVVALFHPQHRALHDLASGTVVVKK